MVKKKKIHNIKIILTIELVNAKLLFFLFNVSGVMIQSCWYSDQHWIAYNNSALCLYCGPVSSIWKKGKLFIFISTSL